MPVDVTTLRDSTAYPVYRGLTTVVLAVGYLASALLVLFAVSDMETTGDARALIVNLVTAVVLILLTQLLREGLQMAADVADTVLAKVGAAEGAVPEPEPESTPVPARDPEPQPEPEVGPRDRVPLARRRS